MKPFLFILANEATADVLHQVLVNEVVPGEDGWALLLPYGEHPNTRYILQNGQQVRQDFLQIVDEAAVDEIIANEKSAFTRLKRFFIRRPIYRGHPDFKGFVPEVIANEAPLTPLGTVDDYRKSERGLEVKLGLVERGAQAVGEGCKYTSALVMVQTEGAPVNGIQRVRVCRILSVGLTPHPNISGVDSLANARVNTPAAKQEPQQKKEDEMKALLIGWLAAQGITLANEASEQAVFDATKGLFVTRSGELTTLANDKAGLVTEKTSLTGQITTLTSERDTAKNKLTEIQTTLANERKGRIEARVDLAIGQGKLAVADREAKITALINAGDKLEEQLTALANSAVVHKVQTASGTDHGQRKGTLASGRTASEEVVFLANHDPKYKDIPDYFEAQRAVLADHPALAEELKKKPATA